MHYARSILNEHEQPVSRSTVTAVSPRSASDERWGGVDEVTRTRMGVTSLADGEFWMEFGDFCQQFEEASVCTLGPDYDNDGKVDHVGQVRSHGGQIRQPRSGWGRRNPAALTDQGENR